MPRILRWAEHEAISVVPALIYFLLSFNILHFSSVLMLGPGRIEFTSYLGATIGAVFAAKIIIIVRTLPFINLFPHKPMIYNISWKFLVYSFFVLLVQILDFLIRKIHYSKSLTIAFQQLSHELLMSRFWGVQIWVMFLFLIYVVVSEFNRVVGPLALRKMMFGF